MVLVDIDLEDGLSTVLVVVVDNPVDGIALGLSFDVVVEVYGILVVLVHIVEGLSTVLVMVVDIQVEGIHWAMVPQVFDIDLVEGLSFVVVVEVDGVVGVAVEADEVDFVDSLNRGVFKGLRKSPPPPIFFLLKGIKRTTKWETKENKTAKRRKICKMYI